MLAPYRSIVAASKPIRCIESGEIFKNANRVKTWLLKNNITKSKNADAVIKVFVRDNVYQHMVVIGNL